MIISSFPVPSVRLILLATLIALAGCATPGGQGGGNPHYKLGAPYKVNGRWYHPKEEPDYEAIGIASWYGDGFDGRMTANGEIFDKDRLSAAHTTLPLPSLVEVENLENGRKIVVRVNDRGPFVRGRLIDLSYAAAKALRFDDKGLAKVKVRYLGRAELYARAERGGGRARDRIAAVPSPQPAAQPSRRAPPAAASSLPANQQNNEDALAALISTALAAPKNEIWIAIGAFDDLNALEKARIGLPALGETRVVMAEQEGGTARYELQIGPEADADAANARLAALREAGYPHARIVDGAL